MPAVTEPPTSADIVRPYSPPALAPAGAAWRVPARARSLAAEAGLACFARSHTLTVRVSMSAVRSVAKRPAKCPGNGSLRWGGELWPV